MVANKTKLLPQVRHPVWLPISILFVLTIGAYLNNEIYSGSYLDFAVLLFWLVVFVIGYFYSFSPLSGSAPVSKQLSVESGSSVRLVAIISAGFSLAHYAVAGIPLLSLDPDVARMEFMQSGIAFKVIKIYLPFFIMYYLAWIIICQRRNYVDYLFFMFLFVCYALTGGKGAVLWGGVYVLLALYSIGRFPSAKVVGFLAVFVLAVTLSLVKIVVGLDSVADAFLFFLDRLTTISEFGLHVVMNDLNEKLSASSPFDFFFLALDKYFGAGSQDYTPSFGRYVTAEYYGGDIYSFIWELTVTAVADFYVVGGVGLAIAAGVGYFMFISYLWGRVSKSSSLYERFLFVTLWFHFVLFLLTGSLVAELFVRTVPFLVFWIAGFWLVHQKFEFKR